MDWVERFVIRLKIWWFRIVCISDKCKGKVARLQAKKAAGGMEL